MKYFSINKLRNKTLTPIKALNEVVDIQCDNIKATQKDVDTLLNDIEKIREGLTMKNEELKRRLEDIKPTQLKSDFDKIEAQFLKNKISEVPAIKHILDKHAYLEQLKITSRSIFILKEIDGGNKDIIPKLLENENEWVFLCTFLQRVIQINEDQDLHLFLKSSLTKTEDKIVKSFQRAFAKRDKMSMKICYDALRSIQRQDIIIKSFLYLLPLFSEDESKYEEPSEIELEGDINVDYFTSFIDHIDESINVKFHEFIPVFVDYEIVLESICKKLYESAIYNRLEGVLSTKNAIIYLLNLKVCYQRIQKLSESIKSISSDVKTNDFLHELFDPFVQTAVDKEKTAFEVFFDLVARKKNTGPKFLLHGELLLHTDPHPTTVISKLIRLYSDALVRGQILGYSPDDLYDYKAFVIKKLKELIGLICGNFTEPDRLKLIKQLCDTFLIMQKIFFSEDHFYEFRDAIEDRIEIIFNNRIDESKAKYKHLIKKLSISDFENNNTPIMLKLCENIRRDFQLCAKYINGSNGDVFMTHLLKYTQTRLYDQYLSFTYNQTQAGVFLNDMNAINDVVKESNLGDVYEIYEHLVEIGELISCKQEDVNIYASIIKHKIPYSQVKKVLKCRSDYKDVKKYIK